MIPSARFGNLGQPIRRRRASELPFRKKCAKMDCKTGLILQIGQ